MSTEVKVFLSEDFRETCMGYVATAPYRLALTFEVPDHDPLVAAEVAYAVCNSGPAFVHGGVEYPPELHCDPSYLPVVTEYRAGKNRSLSVGDCVEIDGIRYSVDDCGFSKVNWT